MKINNILGRYGVMSTQLIYYVCDGETWRTASTTDDYVGSSDDLRDGFMHFSTKAQVRTSVALHRAGQVGLVLLIVATEALGPDLKWESSRGGQLFPHFYGKLPRNAVLEIIELPLGPDGTHEFPDGYPGLDASVL